MIIIERRGGGNTAEREYSAEQTTCTVHAGLTTHTQPARWEAQYYVEAVARDIGGLRNVCNHPVLFWWEK